MGADGVYPKRDQRAPRIPRIKPFLSYCVARYKQDAEEKAYRIYSADLLKAICERCAGVTIDKRYIEIIDVSKKDNRSCEEITSDIVNRCGLQVKKAAP